MIQLPPNQQTFTSFNARKVLEELNVIKDAIRELQIRVAAPSPKNAKASKEDN